MGSTLECLVIVRELSSIFVYIMDDADCWSSVFCDREYLFVYLLFRLFDKDAVEDATVLLDVDESIERQLAQHQFDLIVIA